MVMLFGLMLGFAEGDNRSLAARDAANGWGDQPAGPHHVPVQPVSLQHVANQDRDPLVLMLVIPDRYRYKIDAAGYTEMGNALYARLPELAGYQAAMVGWEVDTFVTIQDLRDDWRDEVMAGELYGLVLANEILDEFSGATGFTPGYSWIPYRGETRSDPL
jgi:hypothetical protein